MTLLSVSCLLLNIFFYFCGNLWDYCIVGYLSWIIEAARIREDFNYTSYSVNSLRYEWPSISDTFSLKLLWEK